MANLINVLSGSPATIIIEMLFKKFVVIPKGYFATKLKALYIKKHVTVLFGVFNKNVG